MKKKIVGTTDEVMTHGSSMYLYYKSNKETPLQLRTAYAAMGNMVKRVSRTTWS